MHGWSVVLFLVQANCTGGCRCVWSGRSCYWTQDFFFPIDISIIWLPSRVDSACLLEGSSHFDPSLLFIWMIWQNAPLIVLWFDAYNWKFITYRLIPNIISLHSILPELHGPWTTSNFNAGIFGTRFLRPLMHVSNIWCFCWPCRLQKNGSQALHGCCWSIRKLNVTLSSNILYEHCINWSVFGSWAIWQSSGRDAVYMYSVCKV